MELQHSSIGQNILVIDKYMKLYLKIALKPHNLNTAEGMVLLTLYCRDGRTGEEILSEIHGKTNGKFGITQEQIIDELHYDKGFMTRTMQALESKGYVTRQDNNSDGRSYIFMLTKKANDFKPSLIELLRFWSDGILLGIDMQLVEVIDKALKQMAENAKNIIIKNEIT